MNLRIINYLFIYILICIFRLDFRLNIQLPLILHDLKLTIKFLKNLQTVEYQNCSFSQYILHFPGVFMCIN
jgi:hypothetical protein